MARPALIATVLAIASTVAAADEIKLTNGRTLTGVVASKDANKVVVEVGAGTITLEAKDVSSVNPGRTPIHEYQDKFAAVKSSTNPKDWWALAVWAEENKLPRYGFALASRVIELDPDHAGARAELRHEKVGGRWVTYEQAQEARGLKWNGERWVTEAETALAEKRRLEATERRMAAAQVRDERRLEDEMRRKMAVDDYNQRMNRVMSQLDGYFYSPSFAFTTPYFRPYWYAPYLRSRRYYQEGWMYNGYGGGGTFDLFRFIPDPFLKKK